MLMLLITNGCKGGSNVSEVDSKIKTYSEDDVRNRTLKEAIKFYNQGSYKAANNTLNKAEGERLRDEDMEIVKELRTEIEKKLQVAITALEALAGEGKLFAYDFEYNTINNNFETSSIRSRIEQSKKIYLERLNKENRNYLTRYFVIVQSLKNITKQKTSGTAVEYYTDTTPIRLRIIINGFESPKIFFDLIPSQLESELETITISSSTVGLFFNKSSPQVYNYNISTNKIISFNLHDNEAKLNMTNFIQMLEDGAITIDTKWFYEPETNRVSAKSIKNMSDVLNIYKAMYEEYQHRSKDIYVPRHVK